MTCLLLISEGYLYNKQPFGCLRGLGYLQAVFQSLAYFAVFYSSPKYIKTSFGPPALWNRLALLNFQNNKVQT